MPTVSEIRPIKRNAEPDLLARPGVTGVDIGDKYVGGNRTAEKSIRVYVEKKKRVAADQKIPETIDGIKTDVIERVFVLQPRMVNARDLVLQADTSTYDPLLGGISMGPCRLVTLDAEQAACQGAPGPGTYAFVGTLGAIVTDNATGAEMLLSNFHVMCVDDGWSVGDTMAQPSRVDGGNCPADIVGSLQRASLGGRVDCAVASHTARGFQCSIAEIGTVAGTATATEGMAVRKRGRTTGLTHGTVDSVDLSVTIDYCDGLGVRTLTDQIGIEVDSTQSAQFGNGGDSGSVVVDSSGNVIGLYFAGTPDGTIGAANPISAVLTALNVTLCTSPKKSEPDTPIKKFEPESPIKKLEPESPIKKLEPDTVIKKFEPESPIKKLEPETIKKLEPESPIKKLEPDTVIKKFEPESPIKKLEPETIKKLEPESPIKKMEPDTIKKLEPESPIKKLEPDTIKKLEPESPIKKLEPESIKKLEPESPIKKLEPDTIKKLEPESIKKLEPDKKSEPDTIKKLEPESIKKLEPDKKPEPDTIKKLEPESIKKLEPDKKFEPDTIKKLEPESIKKLEPESIKKLEPDKKQEPDTKKHEPDTKKFEPDGPTFPGMPELVERVARLESAVNTLTHFIRPEERPDVSSAPLRKEKDVKNDDS